MRVSWWVGVTGVFSTTRKLTTACFMDDISVNQKSQTHQWLCTAGHSVHGSHSPECKEGHPPQGESKPPSRGVDTVNLASGGMVTASHGALFETGETSDIKNTHFISVEPMIS